MALGRALRLRLALGRLGSGLGRRHTLILWAGPGALSPYAGENARLPQGEKRPKRSCHSGRLVHDLAVREPDDVVAPQLQVEVTGAVGFESRATAMEAIAVSLDDQAAVPPQKVDEEGTNPDVHCGWREAMPAAEAQEAPLELAAGAIGAASDRESQDLQPGESPAGPPRASPTRGRSARVRAGLVTGMPLRRLVTAGVSKRERCRRMPRRLRRPPERRHRDVDRAVPMRQQAPQLRGAAVAECRVVAIRKHSGHPPSLLAQASVPHRIHAAVNSVEVTRLDSAGHGPLGDAGGDQLGK